MEKRILVTGGTGMVGTYLKEINNFNKINTSI